VVSTIKLWAVYYEIFTKTRDSTKLLQDAPDCPLQAQKTKTQRLFRISPPKIATRAIR
jgi:hypothetical protein